MTNHEAIQFLNNMIGEEHGRSIGADGFYRELCAYHVDALRIAIKALEQEPKTGHWEWVQYDYNPKLGNWQCSECRCVVIECVDKNEKGCIPLYKYCPQCGIKIIDPQKSEKTCDTYQHNFESEHMSRVIKGLYDSLESEEISSEEIAALLARGSEEMTREDAIEALEQEPCDVSDTNVGKTDAISRQAAIEKIHWLSIDKDTAIMCDLAIRALPSVTPKQRTGRWIKEDILTYKCSACGGKAIIANWTPVLSDFCPNCGLKMESEEQA